MATIKQTAEQLKRSLHFTQNHSHISMFQVKGKYQGGERCLETSLPSGEVPACMQGGPARVATEVRGGERAAESPKPPSVSPRWTQDFGPG